MPSGVFDCADVPESPLQPGKSTCLLGVRAPACADGAGTPRRGAAGFLVARHQVGTVALICVRSHSAAGPGGRRHRDRGLCRRWFVISPADHRSPRLDPLGEPADGAVAELLCDRHAGQCERSSTFIGFGDIQKIRRSIPSVTSPEQDDARGDCVVIQRRCLGHRQVFDHRCAPACAVRVCRPVCRWCHGAPSGWWSLWRPRLLSPASPRRAAGTPP